MLRASRIRPEGQGKAQVKIKAHAATPGEFLTKKCIKMACSCQKSADKVAGTKKGRRRKPAVGGIRMQPLKGLLNVKTGIAAGGTVLGLKKLTEGAEGEELAVLRSKEGAMYEGLAGVAGVLLIENPWLRGVAAGLVVDGGKKYLTGKDWDDIPLKDKMDEVGIAGYPYYPVGNDRSPQNGSGGRRRMRYA